MISKNIIPLTFFAPQIIAGIIFIRTFNRTLRLYRKKINPDYPILPFEASSYFNKNPIGYILKMPIMPLLIWMILFKNHEDLELNHSCNKARISFLFYIGIMLVTLFVHFLALYYNIFI